MRLKKMGVLSGKVKGRKKGRRLRIQKVDLVICGFSVLAGLLLSYGLDRAQSSKLKNKDPKTSIEALFRDNKDLLKDRGKKVKIMEFLKKG